MLGFIRAHSPALALIFAAGTAQAAGAGGGLYAPILVAGPHFFAGDAGTSLTGATGYSLIFAAENRKGFFRPNIAAEFQYASGLASIGSASPSCSLFGTAFAPGVHLVPLDVGRFQPFLGGAGLIAWHYMKLPTPPTGTPANSEGLGFGYEITAGVDIRLGSIEGNALRLQGGFWSLSSSLADVSGFQLSGFRFGIGVVY